MVVRRPLFILQRLKGRIVAENANAVARIPVQNSKSLVGAIHGTNLGSNDNVVHNVPVTNTMI